MFKFRFITIVHNLDFESTEEIEIHLKPNWILSNKISVLQSTFENNLSIGTLGVHSIDEFENNVFFYIDSSFGDAETIDDINKKGTSVTIALLRAIQHYVFSLWEIQDNSIYIRDGFLYVYKEHINSGITFKGSLSAIISFSNNIVEKSIVSFDNLKKGAESISGLSLKDILSDSNKYRNPTYDHFFKYSKSERTERAWYFIQTARIASTLPMKIVFYCTALECFFSTSRSELVHRIAERVAILIGKNHKEKIRLYNFIKKAYDIRSTIVHGSVLKGQNDDLEEISVELDGILRAIINSESVMLSKSDEELDLFFIEELFGKEES